MVSKFEIFIDAFIGIFILVGLIAPLSSDIGTNSQVIAGSGFGYKLPVKPTTCPFGVPGCPIPRPSTTILPPTTSTITTSTTTQPKCKSLYGDGICQTIVCQAIGCPCPETSVSCPQDCKSTTTTLLTTTTKSSGGSSCRYAGGVCASSCSSEKNLGKMDCYMICCKL